MGAVESIFVDKLFLRRSPAFGRESLFGGVHGHERMEEGWLLPEGGTTSPPRSYLICCGNNPLSRSETVRWDNLPSKGASDLNPTQPNP
jgi:hypothetical protein